MNRILLFEAWSVNAIATAINNAVSGLGTDEEGLVSALLNISNRQTLIDVNKLMSGSDSFAYQTVGDAIEGELGDWDEAESKRIKDHFKKIGASDLLSATRMPVSPEAKLIASIVPRVKQHEGVEDTVYKDSRGIPTIGVGFNLNRDDSSQKLKAVGANPVKVKAGQAKLSTYQIDTLLMQDLIQARRDAADLFPNFNQLPAQVQGVLIEMTFNLGKRGLSEFKNFISHISAKRYDSAAQEMLRSAWAKQVGQRAINLSNIIKTA